MSELVAVAIPARDEAQLIGRCLDSLAAQQGAGPFVVVVLANDCTDETVAIARTPRGIAVEVHERSFSAHQQSAGHARRIACAIAAERAPLILTTDADCVVDPDWISAYRAVFATGVDAVAGRMSGDPEGMARLSPRATEIGLIEWEYSKLRTQAQALFDPVPHDPWPRHSQSCGANLGITRDMLLRIGGIPDIPCAEDHALVAAVERIGGRVRHADGPHVTASARLIGRARGGMADALAARDRPGYLCDEEVLPADDFVARLRERAAARQGGEHHRLRPLETDQRIAPERLPAEIARLRAIIAAHG